MAVKACLANTYGGTSFAAPMWAGFVALLNEQLAHSAKPPIGCLNESSNVPAVLGTLVRQGCLGNGKTLSCLYSAENAHIGALSSLTFVPRTKQFSVIASLSYWRVYFR